MTAYAKHCQWWDQCCHVSLVTGRACVYVLDNNYLQLVPSVSIIIRNSEPIERWGMRESGRIYIIIVHDNFTCSIMYSYTHTHTQAETTPPSIPHHDYGNIAGVVMEAPSLCVCVWVWGVQRKKHKLQNTVTPARGEYSAKTKTIASELNPLTGTQNYC